MTDAILNNVVKITSEFRMNVNIVGAVPAISFRILYPVNNNIPMMTGVLTGNNKQIVECKAPDGFTITGEIISRVTEAEMVLLANIYSGPEGSVKNHFEGVAVSYPIVVAKV